MSLVDQDLRAVVHFFHLFARDWWHAMCVKSGSDIDANLGLIGSTGIRMSRLGKYAADR